MNTLTDKFHYWHQHILDYLLRNQLLRSILTLANCLEHDDSKTSDCNTIAVSDASYILDNYFLTADFHNSAINIDVNESSDDDNDNTNPPNKQHLSLPKKIASPCIIESSDSEGDCEEEVEELSSSLCPGKYGNR